MEVRLQVPGADQRPQGVPSCRSRGRIVQDQPAGLADRRRVPFREEPLGRFAEVDVRARQAPDQVLVAFTCQVEPRRTRRVSVPDPVERPLSRSMPSGSRLASW